jgi:phosphomannomutase
VASLPSGQARTLKIALTPMHGVGGAFAVEALRRAGFTDVHVVRSQAVPDPDFPTVVFPNPEEPGASDELLSLAASVDADLAIALDPDADRCALGVRDGSTWRMLRGDETGVLLGAHLLAGVHQLRPLVATSIVSSGLLGEVAAAYGARFAQTRTGFKWLMRAGDGLVYAYEEALGHCVDPDAVRDKDGISAAVLACDLAATARADGATLDDLLDALAVRHGVHLTGQVSIWLPDHCAVAGAMAALRAAPPAVLAGRPVQVQDLLADPQQPDNTLALHGAGFRVMMRPSGTEPKLKTYLEVIEPVPGPDALAAARQAAARRLAALRTALRTALATALPAAGERPATGERPGPWHRRR